VQGRKGKRQRVMGEGLSGSKRKGGCEGGGGKEGVGLQYGDGGARMEVARSG